MGTKQWWSQIAISLSVIGSLSNNQAGRMERRNLRDRKTFSRNVPTKARHLFTICNADFFLFLHRAS
jgi:hypothetical protein